MLCFQNAIFRFDSRERKDKKLEKYSYEEHFSTASVLRIFGGFFSAVLIA